MQLLYTHCAGLDVHKKNVVACRRKVLPDGTLCQEVSTFETMTIYLLGLCDWLAEWGCTHVAMESTGEYWKPVFNLMEGQFEVLLVNAHHVKKVPGRKSDVKDAEWLCELLAHGLLKASFIPPAAQRDLRDLTRYRTTLVQERARVVNRVQKVLENANIKLASVATDPLGVSGRAILEALAEGQQDPLQLSQLARGRLRNKMAALEQALCGLVRDHHRFLIAQQLGHIDFLDEQIHTLTQQIEQRIKTMGPPPDAPKPKGREQKSSANAEQTPSAQAKDRADSQGLSAWQMVELWDTIPGVDQIVAQVMVAELGVDMRRFPNANHAAAWSGVAPGNHESAGKHYSGRTTKGNQALRHALLQAAWAASHTKDTYLAALYHRLAPRRGKKRAIVAVAHAILVAAYHMAVRRQPYQELGGNFFDERQKESVVHRLSRRLEKLGYTVKLEPKANAA